MAVNIETIKTNLQAFNFKRLFNDLGWDHPQGSPHHFNFLGLTVTLKPVSQKRGFQVFEGTSADGTIPNHAARMRLERELSKVAFEHLVVFVDKDRTKQTWQWARREMGRPLALRTFEYHIDRRNESLVQKLADLAFSFNEEEGITLTDVTRRTRRALDVERVTKRFYELFKKEHDAFYEQVTGLPDEVKTWYTSLMLNRLMFIYFVQKKGFLDGNRDYLRDRFTKVQSKYGAGKFQNFYQHFLLALFHEGLGKNAKERQLDSEMRALLGNVPYLNGGLFEVHQLEEEYKGKITVPDDAFETIFDFFEGYEWHLDDRPLREGNEINPDVLGYIFEKYINQKQMGAYYTKEDITEYISKNTVLPYLLQTVSNDCQIAFTGERNVWQLLAENPDRYIYPAVKHGADLPLPPNIEAGIKDVSRRTDWNRAAPVSHALPTEIWREIVARRTRYQEVRAKLEKGEVTKVEDLITLNLNIRQFTQDALDTAEGSELVKAFWKALTNLSILDPTCGSGAFLFAALNILQPLYEAALDKMQSLVNEADAANSKQKYGDFRKILAEVAKHPNERYFVLKTIVVNNLYGVDIMEEATEIAKLRLFLKLMSQVETPEQIEPLPDVDFNIRAGNALVGFANLKDISASFSGRLDFQFSEQQIIERLDDIEALFKQFKMQQTEYGGAVTSADKQALRKKLTELEEELNHALAQQYSVNPKNNKAYSAWKASHQPFHWFVDFYSIMKKGGFDAIIGNPPYLELREVDYLIKGFKTLDSNAVHAMCMERSLSVLSRRGAISMIVPLALVSTQRMQSIQKMLENNSSTWYANYAWRPGKLFDTVNRALTIFVAIGSTVDKRVYSTSYQKWTSECRSFLIEQLAYSRVPSDRNTFWVPKLGQHFEEKILEKLLMSKKKFGVLTLNLGSKVYYRSTGGLYWKIFTDFAPKFFLNGNPGSSSRETWFSVKSAVYAKTSVAVLSSNTFWYWYTLTSNLRDLNPADLQGFPIIENMFEDDELLILGRKYLSDIEVNSSMLTRQQKQTGTTQTQSFKIQKSKPIIDQIDQVLAKHYGFTDEELDFIVNYDIKYRMGQAALGDEE
jgi:hypothetical protein